MMHLCRGLVRCTLIAATLSAGAQAASPDAITSVTHIDIRPDKLAAAEPVLAAYVAQAAHDPGVLRVELLQQVDAPNHFTLVETVNDRSAYNTHVETAYWITFRTRLGPYLGSPFDERLHRRFHRD